MSLCRCSWWDEDGEVRASGPVAAVLFLPLDEHEWVPENDLSHFVLKAVERVAMESFKVNEGGTGSAQYHPRTMLALLVDCYANGISDLRRAERTTHRDIGVCLVTANQRPDHDKLCVFRRNNFKAVAEAFVEVVLLAKELNLLRVGAASVDGTKVDANASKRNSMHYDRAVQLQERLRVEMEDLLGRAEETDGQDASDPQRLPGELSRRENLCE